MENTLYDVLGCDRKATAAEIRVAYLQRSREVHPDRTGDTSAEGQAAFQRVSAAFSVLSSTAARNLATAVASDSPPRNDCTAAESPAHYAQRCSTPLILASCARGGKAPST